MSRRNFNRKSLALSEALEVSFTLIVIICAIHGFNIILNNWLLQFGILPRTLIGLRGILFSPFLHGNLQHLLANCSTLFVLTTLLFWNRSYKAGRALLLIWLVSGIGTWLLGRPSMHIGASALVYGEIAYLIVAGFYMRSWLAALISVVVFLLYGSLLLGVFPQDQAISWEGHLCGAIAGAWAARKVNRKSSRTSANRSN